MIRSGGKYYDTIWNKCKRDFIEADNFEEAIQKVDGAVGRDKIILDVDDYDDREIVPSEYFEGGKVPEGKDVSFYWHIGEDN